MKKIKSFLLLFSCIVLTVAACKKEDAVQAVATTVSNPLNSFSCKIDSAAYTPLTITANTVSASKQITAVSTSVQISLTLFTTVPGTYTYSIIDAPKFSLSYLEIGASAAALSLTSGSLTISSYDAGTGVMKGTFSGTLSATSGKGKTITQGAFTVTFKQ